MKAILCAIVLMASFSIASADGWYDGGADKSCTEGCSELGLICSEQELFEHNDEVDTSEEVLALIVQVGGSTTDTACTLAYGTNENVPSWVEGGSDGCAASSPNRPLSTFNCDKPPLPVNTDKHRLCYCVDPDGWYKSGVDKSCTEGCSELGLICTEQALWQHNDEVDTSAEVLALITQVGGSTTDTDCTLAYGSNENVPGWVEGGSDGCAASSPNRPLSTFNCDKQPAPLNQNKQRLCYCHAPRTNCDWTVCNMNISGKENLNGDYVQSKMITHKDVPIFCRTDGAMVIRYFSSDANGWDVCEAVDCVVTEPCSGNQNRRGYIPNVDGLPREGSVIDWQGNVGQLAQSNPEVCVPQTCLINISGSQDGHIDGGYVPTGEIYKERSVFCREDGLMAFRYASTTTNGWDWCAAVDCVITEPCGGNSGRKGYRADGGILPSDGNVVDWQGNAGTLSTTTTDPALCIPQCTMNVQNKDNLNGNYFPVTPHIMHGDTPVYCREDGSMVIRYYSTDKNGWDVCEAVDCVVTEPCSGNQNRRGYVNNDEGWPKEGNVVDWSGNSGLLCYSQNHDLCPANVNMHAPTFASATLTASVDEDASVGDVVFTLEATDLDQRDPNNVVVYEIASFVPTLR